MLLFLLITDNQCQCLLNNIWCVNFEFIPKRNRCEQIITVQKSIIECSSRFILNRLDASCVGQICSIWWKILVQIVLFSNVRPHILALFNEKKIHNIISVIVDRSLSEDKTPSSTLKLTTYQFSQ